MKSRHRYLIKTCSISGYGYTVHEVYCMETTETCIKLKYLDHPDQRIEWVKKTDIQTREWGDQGFVILEDLGKYNLKKR